MFQFFFCSYIWQRTLMTVQFFCLCVDKMLIRGYVFSYSLVKKAADDDDIIRSTVFIGWPNMDSFYYHHHTRGKYFSVEASLKKSSMVAAGRRSSIRGFVLTAKKMRCSRFFSFNRHIDRKKRTKRKMSLLKGGRKHLEKSHAWIRVCEAREAVGIRWLNSAQWENLSKY